MCFENQSNIIAQFTSLYCNRLLKKTFYDVILKTTWMIFVPGVYAIEIFSSLQTFWQHQVFLNPQRYCSFCTPKGGERLFHEVFPAITRLLGSTGVAPVKSVNTSIEIIYTLPATRCTVYSGEKELNFNIHGSDSSQKIYCRMFLRIVHSISFRKGIN